MVRKTNLSLMIILVTGMIFWACESGLDGEMEISESVMEVAEISSQVASGTKVFLREGNDQNAFDAPFNRNGKIPGGSLGTGMGMLLFKVYGDEDIRLIPFAERMGELNTMRIFDSIADITHYDATGSEVVTGGDFLPGQFLKGNEMQVVKTVVDFGSGKTITRMRNQITIAGKLIIERSFENKILTEKVEMQGISLNEVSIHGTKFIQRSFDPDKGEAHTQMVVQDANIVFENGEVGSWNSESSRKVSMNSKTANGPAFSQFVSESNTSITMEDGRVFYSHETLKPLVTNMDCPDRKLVSGILEIFYEGNLISVDYGDGECQSQMNITVDAN